MSEPSAEPAVESLAPPALVAAIDALYAELAADVGRTGVVCQGRGDCCDFDRVDHVLYATATEVARAAQAQTANPEMNVAVVDGSVALCPFWHERRCLAREVRPLGCRVYFCDPGYHAEHAPLLYERYHARLASLIEAAGVPYRYEPFVAALRRVMPH